MWQVDAPNLGRATVLAEIGVERDAQDEKWGEHNHPDGTGPNLPLLYGSKMPSFSDLANSARTITDLRAKLGKLTWADILLEEVFEALAEDDATKLRTELVQVSAVATAWVEAIDRRNSA